jgi:putative flippase GtrA
MVVWDSERWAPLREHDETLKPLIAAAMAPLLDAGLFCALIGYGLPLRSSHIASFTAGAALNYLLKVRSTVAAERRTRDWR